MMTGVETVWGIIAELVKGTKGGLIKLSPLRIRKMAEKKHIRVDRKYERTVYLVLNYTLRECKAFPDLEISAKRMRRRTAHYNMYYVYNLACVKKVLESVGYVID